MVSLKFIITYHIWKRFVSLTQPPTFCFVIMLCFIIIWLSLSQIRVRERERERLLQEEIERERLREQMAIERELQRRQVSLTLTTPISNYLTIHWLSSMLPFCLLLLVGCFCTSCRWNENCLVNMWYWMKTKNRWWNDSKHYGNLPTPQTNTIYIPYLCTLSFFTLSFFVVSPSPFLDGVRPKERVIQFPVIRLLGLMVVEEGGR